MALKNKQPVVIPQSALRRAGFKSGQELEVRASGGVITIIPRPPGAQDEYTPQQRRVIDARLAEARKGPWHGPFETAEDAILFVNKNIGKRKAARRKTTT
ncbi:MAG TPA: AbrB/MazE/SpoVT family DNA-binding domain-containing protein [Bryobacteraceae bacterium]